MQWAFLNKGKITKEAYDSSREYATDFHMTPAFVHKTKNSLSIYFTDSLGFAPSGVLKSYCYYLGSLEKIPNIDVYVYPSTRQRSLNCCSVFSLLDLIYLTKYPHYISFIKDQSTLSDELWGDNGYLLHLDLSVSESMKMHQDSMDIYGAVFEEYKEHLEAKGERTDNLVSFDIKNEDMVGFMFYKSNVYKPLKERTTKMIQSKIILHVKNIHMHKFSVLPPPMMQYTQSITSLNKYMNDNPILINEYDKNRSGSSYKEEIQKFSFEEDGKSQNKMMEHYFKKYARVVLKDIL